MRERLNARSDIASQSPSSSSYVHVTPLWATPPPLSRYLNQLDRARRFLHRIANRTKRILHAHPASRVEGEHPDHTSVLYDREGLALVAPQEPVQSL